MDASGIDEQPASEGTTTASGCSGCFVVLIVVSLAGLLAWIGVTTLFQGAAPAQGLIPPKVIDHAGLFSNAAIRAIEDVRFPPDVAVIVRTVPSLDTTAPGPAATDLMQREPHWQIVRPRTWQQQLIRRDAPWSKGVYFIVSRDPALVQVRFGEHIRLEAYRTGLASGPAYRRWQESFSIEYADAQLTEHVRELAQQLPIALDLPWYLRYTRGLASSAFAEVEDLVLPAEGAFRRFALRGYTRLLRWLNAAESGWRFIAISAAAYVVLWIAGIAGVHFGARRHTLGAVVAGSLLLFVAGVTYFIGAIGSLLLLSSGRLEDELLLRDLGLHQFATTGLDAAYFSAPGSMGLALLTAVVGFAGAFAAHFAEAAEARARGEILMGPSSIKAPLAWGALVLFLPRALGLFVLLHLVATGVASLVGLARASMKA